MAQGALTPLPKPSAEFNESISSCLSDDTKMTPTMQDLYLEQQRNMHREHNQQVRLQQQLREAALGYRK